MIGRALVLGGTGFVGSHVVERLAASGIPVRAASRRGRWPWGESPAGVTSTAFDLAHVTAVKDWDALIEGATHVVNLAGVLYRPGLPRDLYRRVHVDSVRHLLDALRRARGRVRLVHVSTTGVLGPTGPSPLDETAPPRPTTVYEATKAEGEAVALAGRRDGLEVVVVRPGLVYGERDLHLLALWRAIGAGTFRTIGGGTARWQPVHVEDVAGAIVAALEGPGGDGQVFHVAGAEEVGIGDLAARIAARLGTRLRGGTLPVPLARAAGAAMEALLLPFGVDPPLSRSRVRTMTEHRLYRIDRAREVLGVVPRVGLDRGLDRTAAWYRDRALL